MKARSTGLRSFASAVAILLSLTVLAACGSGSTDSGGPAASGPKIRIAVGIDASFAPFFLADAKGMFADQGLNVEIVQFGQGGEAVDAIASGEVQLAGNSDTTTIGRLQQNPDLRALLIYQESGRYLKVVTREDARDPSKIKKMGVVPGLSELAAIKFLESKKIDPDAVEFVSAGPPEIPALLEKGDVDAYVLWEPWPAKGVEQGGKILETTGDYGMTYVHWLVTGQKWLSGNQETAAKIAKVLDEAAAQVEADPKAAAEATQKAAKVPTDQTLTAIKEIDFKVRDITDADTKAYEDTADFYVSTGKLKTRPDVPPALNLNWFSQHAKG